MRLPRWVVVSLIAASVVALVAVPAWLWVEMPRRTAMKFAAIIDSNDATAANQLMINVRCARTWNGQWSLTVTHRDNISKQFSSQMVQ